ncbi:hypothetical protein DFH29DRAFT_882730 [Suillus ampliporus]|nr:hypothetical protein DFH29DRAFT_882730 [Suillus ampliporus]
MPIDQWTPLRITAQFKGLEFRSLGYNMSLETWIETPDSCFGDLTPDTYERCFAAMLQHSQGKARPPISGWSSATESVNEGKAVNDQVADGPLYNLRGNQSTAVDHSTGSDDDAPVYDLAWGATVTSGQEAEVVLCDEDALAYDLGWGVTTAAEQPMQQDVTPVSGDADDGPVYDLGWGVNSPGEEPMEEDDDDGPSYDLGEAEDTILQENRRLKVIGNDMNQHIHAIIENAVHGLDDSRAPGQILIENRHVLGGFAEARNQVTSVGSEHVQAAPSHPASTLAVEIGGPRHRVTGEPGAFIEPTEIAIATMQPMCITNNIINDRTKLAAYLELGFLDLFGEHLWSCFWPFLPIWFNPRTFVGRALQANLPDHASFLDYIPALGRDCPLPSWNGSQVYVAVHHPHERRTYPPGFVQRITSGTFLVFGGGSFSRFLHALCLIGSLPIFGDDR